MWWRTGTNFRGNVLRERMPHRWPPCHFVRGELVRGAIADFQKILVATSLRCPFTHLCCCQCMPRRQHQRVMVRIPTPSLPFVESYVYAYLQLAQRSLSSISYLHCLYISPTHRFATFFTFHPYQARRRRYGGHQYIARQTRACMQCECLQTRLHLSRMALTRCEHSPTTRQAGVCRRQTGSSLAQPQQTC